MTAPAEYFPVLPDDGPSDLQRWREGYRRSRTRRSTALAGVSTVIFLTVVGAAIVLSPGWPRVNAVTVSIMPTVPKATHEPQSPWSFTGVT